MDMDNGLPRTIREVKAEIQFYRLIETHCDLLRTGPRAEFAAVASRELARVRERLHKLGLRQLKLAPKRKTGK